MQTTGADTGVCSGIQEMALDLDYMWPEAMQILQAIQLVKW